MTLDAAAGRVLADRRTDHGMIPVDNLSGLYTTRMHFVTSCHVLYAYTNMLVTGVKSDVWCFTKLERAVDVLHAMLSKSMHHRRAQLCRQFYVGYKSAILIFHIVLQGKRLHGVGAYW